MWDFFGTTDLGVDLGTGRTRMVLENEGMVLNESTVVARSWRSGKILAVGDKARVMIGRAPRNVEIIRPLEQGVIADFETAKILLRTFLRRVVGKRSLSKPRMVISISSGVTSVEKRAVLDAALEAGAREAYLLEKPLAAALGAGVPVKETEGILVLDIGAGCAEAAVFSLGRTVRCQVLRRGGLDADRALVQYCRRKYNLLIGEQQAEKAKIEIGTVAAAHPPAFMEIRGRNLLSGLPEAGTITQTEMREAFQEPVRDLADMVKNLLETVPGPVMEAVAKNGMLLTGGGALLRNIDGLLSRETGLPVRVAEDAQGCTARGTGQAAGNINAFRREKQRYSGASGREARI